MSSALGLMRGFDQSTIRPFQGRLGAAVGFRGRCPRLLYESPSGILTHQFPPCVQPNVWDKLSPSGEGRGLLHFPLLLVEPRAASSLAHRVVN
jgi:hypothetical protein